MVALGPGKRSTCDRRLTANAFARAARAVAVGHVTMSCGFECTDVAWQGRHIGSPPAAAEPQSFGRFGVHGTGLHTAHSDVSSCVPTNSCASVSEPILFALAQTMCSPHVFSCLVPTAVFLFHTALHAARCRKSYRSGRSVLWPWHSASGMPTERSSSGIEHAGSRKQAS